MVHEGRRRVVITIRNTSEASWRYEPCGWTRKPRTPFKKSELRQACRSRKRSSAGSVRCRSRSGATRDACPTTSTGNWISAPAGTRSRRLRLLAVVFARRSEKSCADDSRSRSIGMTSKPIGSAAGTDTTQSRSSPDRHRSIRSPRAVKVRSFDVGEYILYGLHDLIGRLEWNHVTAVLHDHLPSAR